MTGLGLLIYGLFFIGCFTLGSFYIGGAIEAFKEKRYYKFGFRSMAAIAYVLVLARLLFI